MNPQTVEKYNRKLTEFRDLLAENPFALTTRVYFELSNRCNLAAHHSRCPIGPTYNQEKMEAGGTLKYKDYLCQGSYLPRDVIERSIMELGEYNFDGIVNFHRYNDPIINADYVRELVRFTREYCPNASILIYTNALQLNENLLENLILDGVTHFVISAYNESMLQKVSGFKEKIGRFQQETGRTVSLDIFKFLPRGEKDIWGNNALDDRMTLYDRAAKGVHKESPYGICRAPLSEVTISHTGEMVACCLDWKDTINFGNIKSEKLEDICRNEDALRFYTELAVDYRRHDICKACGWSRGGLP